MAYHYPIGEWRGTLVGMSWFWQGPEIRCVRSRFGGYAIEEIKRRDEKVHHTRAIYRALEGDSEEDIRGKLLMYLRALDQPTIDERV
jgi:hypothetical protein